MKMLVTIFSLTLSLSTQADDESNKPLPVLNVEIDSPTMIHHLKYKEMYSEKPFEDATLYYYSNGIYKIISPGEEHYGVYVIKGGAADITYAISYMSLPSSDWGGNVAKHDLIFHNDTGRFEQQALAQIDQEIPLQSGVFQVERNTVIDPLPLKWKAR